jgi:hypothetical protein
MQEKIDQSNFNTWKKDPVTTEVFKCLQEIRDETNLALTNADIVLGANREINVPRLFGLREALDLMLQISFEDLEEETKGDSDESK